MWRIVDTLSLFQGKVCMPEDKPNRIESSEDGVQSSWLDGTGGMQCRRDARSGRLSDCQCDKINRRGLRRH